MINWGGSDFVDPNTKIEGNQVPLEAIKTSADRLQDAYLRAQDTDTKTQVAMKRLLMSTDPADHEAAGQLYSDYQARIGERVKNGDYENMLTQTTRDAGDFAVNMDALLKRKEKIDSGMNEVLNQKGILDPIKRQRLSKLLRSQIPSAQYDPGIGVMNNLDVNPEKFADDVDTTALLNTLGQGWKADVKGTGATSYRISDGTLKDSNGTYFPTGVVVKTNGQNRLEEVKGDEVKQALTKALQNNPAFMAVVNRDTKLDMFENPLKEGESPESRVNRMFQNHSANALDFVGEKYGYKEKTSVSTSDLDYNLATHLQKAVPGWSQLPSTNFQNQPGELPVKIDEKGNITVKGNLEKDAIKYSSAAGLSGGFPLHGLLGDEYLPSSIKADGNENSLAYKRTKQFLIDNGTIKNPADKVATNTIIKDFWNTQLNLINSSIAVPFQEDEQNKFTATTNANLFGDPSPGPKKGNTINIGQAALHSFVSEDGKPLTPAEFKDENADKNISAIGKVNQWRSPFEYGETYLVSNDDGGKDTKHFRMSPDLNTKNSGAYFANRIFNSTTKRDMTSDWQDGYGNKYEATPIKDGFVIYVNNDVKTPLVFNEKELESLSQLPPGTASQALSEYYKAEKAK